MPGRMHHVGGLLKAAGVSKTCEILIRRAVGASGAVAVSINGCRLEVRPRDSDPFALSQVFGWQEYGIDAARLAILRKTAAEWLNEGVTPLIIDAGSNVGYAALYFSNLFPEACILAVEPDQTSFEILARHVRSNVKIRPIHAALWSHNRGLELKTTNTGSWGNYVVEGAGTPSQRLDSLANSIPRARPLIVKLDIEGAEREVVESAPDIFAAAKCIVVEPHDFMKLGSAGLSPLYKIAAARRFDTILRGENVFLFAVD
jgi:FkbM family methyltransferase